jgi:acyl-CoA synthetase (AMP-forming)/AMP-acid ligase II
MSAPIPSFGREFEQRFGLRFIQSYSLTDFGPSHAFSLVDPVSKLGSCGRARRGIRARIVDEDDFELPPGERGELVLRHDMPWTQSQGYYKMPEVTAKAWRNSWFHTGDSGYVDAQGYPNRPIAWVVPYAAGAATDVLTRRLAQDMSIDLGQPIVVENVPGAGTVNAAVQLARAKPDGSPLLLQCQPFPRRTLGSKAMNLMLGRALSLRLGFQRKFAPG